MAKRKKDLVQSQDLVPYHKGFVERLKVLVSCLVDAGRAVRAREGVKKAIDLQDDPLVRELTVRISEHYMTITSQGVFIPDLEETIKNLKKVRKPLAKLAKGKKGTYAKLADTYLGSIIAHIEDRFKRGMEGK